MLLNTLHRTHTPHTHHTTPHTTHHTMNDITFKVRTAVGEIADFTLRFRKRIQVLSRHTTLAEAVTAANIDLSYNEQEARRSIADMDSKADRIPYRLLTALVVDAGEGKRDVLHLLEMKREKLWLLGAFTPFYSMMDSVPFAAVQDNGDHLLITAQCLPRDVSVRRWAALQNIILTTL